MSRRDAEFEEFVRSVRGRLVRFATLMYAGDSHRAEDAVQVALTRVYLAWPRIQPITREAYLRRTLVNTVIDERRRAVVRAELTVADVPDLHCPAGEAHVDANDVSDVLAALARLPARMRAAIVLRYVDGLSVAETADVLQCSEGTVKSQSARALDKMRAALPARAWNAAHGLEAVPA